MMKRQFSGLVLVGILTAAGFPGEAFGQRLRIPQPSSGTIGGELNSARIANSPIAQNFNVTQGGGYTRPPVTTATAPLEGVSFLIRQGEVGGDLVGSRDGPLARARAVPKSWTQTLSTGGVSRYFGRSIIYSSAQMQMGLTNASLLLDPQALLASTAFSAPARVLGVSSGRPNDILSSKDDSDTPSYSVQSLTRAKGLSQSDMLESHLAVEHGRHLKQGWEWYSLGEYAKARSAFATAENLDRSDAESRAGSFFCAVAQERYTEAIFGMRKIMTWDGRRNLFKHDLKLLSLSMPKDEDLVDPERIGKERLGRQIQRFVKFAAPAGTASISPLGLASLAYALWHGGQQAEAVHAAQTLLEMDPGGSFSHLLDNMIAAREDSQDATDD